MKARPIIAAALVWATMMAVLCALYMTAPPSPDQSQFDWMAFAATRGRPYYAGSFDMNWPGAMWLHEAGIRLFGVNPWTWRLTDFLLMAGFAGAGAIFLARAGWRMAPAVFLFLYPPLYVTAGWWLAGQRDIIATGFLLIAAALALPGRSFERASVAMAGLCVAAAVLIRPTFLSFAAGLMLLEALPLSAPQQRRLRRPARAIWMAAGCASGLAAAALYGLAAGNIDDWYQQSFEFALSIYVADPPLDWRATLFELFVRSWHWLSVLALGGLAVWAWRDRSSYALVVLAGAAATSAVSFAVQNKGFGYHLGGILTVLTMLAAVLIDALASLWREAPPGPRRQAAGAILGLVVLIALGGIAGKLSSYREGALVLLAGKIEPVAGYGLTEAERREIVDLIRGGSAPDETVAVYGVNYELAYRAERLPAYRFFTPAADQLSPDFTHYEAWLEEIDAALADNPPAFAVVQSRAIAVSPEDAARTHAGRPIRERLLAHLATGYEVAFRNDSIIVYRRVR